MPDPTEIPWLLDAAGNAAIGLAAGAWVSVAKQSAGHAFRRDDLYGWIRHAVGDQFGKELSKGELDALRGALDEEQTWELLGTATADRLAERLADCFSRDRQTDSRLAAGLFVARSLYESTLHFSGSPVWAQVMEARLRRQSGQLDRVAASLVGIQALLVDSGTPRAEGWSLLQKVTQQLDADHRATQADVLVYLRRRLRDWDAPTWLSGARRPSIIERRLQARERPAGQDRGASANGPEPVEMSADDALSGSGMLVVLGGPGSGKTWLARRYARQSAISALAAIHAGWPIESVELPLYTTWGDWARTDLPGGGDTREHLATAAFALGLGNSDLGGGGIVRRLQRTFTDPTQRVLVIVDSLDEAAASAGQEAHLRTLTSVAAWRTIVTSRPSAWDATAAAATLTQPKDVRVVELQQLDLRADVEPYVRSWFADDPARGSALLTQIDQRPDLRPPASRCCWGSCA